MLAVLLRLLFLFVLVLLALRAAGRFIGGVREGVSGSSRPRTRQSEPPVKMARDPVCGTFVVPGKALSVTSGGATEWFCSETCRDAFARRG